jgi:hypothetical protein
MSIIILLTINLCRDARNFRLIQSVLSRLRTGRPIKRSLMPGRYSTSDSSLLRSVQNGCGDCSGLAQLANGAAFPGVRWPGRKADCYLRLASGLRMSGGHIQTSFITS